MVNVATGSANVPDMAMEITLLPDEVIDQIAAGEVIERPASVLRELLDNALDAGAKRVIVEVEGGGIERLMVLDDGVGMSPDNATRATLRHATSKIRQIGDLEDLRSRGFRGEALASVAAVSRLQITTRAHDNELATRILCDPGHPTQTELVAAPKGTTVEVCALFFNTPARRKFLKSRPTETAHIHRAFTRTALSRPDVRFELRRAQNRTKLFTATDHEGRAKQVFGSTKLATIAPSTTDGVSIRAFLSPPESARAGATHLHLFINGRPVRDNALSRSVAFAYGSVLAPGRYPAGCVYIEVDPKSVDINVHPQKLEVRFSNARKVHEATTRALATALGTQPWQRPQSSAIAARSGALAASSGANKQDESAYGSTQDAWASLSILRDASSTHAPQALPHAPGPFSSLRPIAQLQALFVVCEGADGLYVLDQHAVDERIRYAKLKRTLQDKKLAGQKLLFPAQVELGEQTLAWLDQHAGSLSEIGIDASRISDTEVLVREVPSLVANADPAQLVAEACAELMRTGAREWSDRIDTALATMACHAALRRGDKISLSEAAELLAQLDAAESFAEHCPHGRPVVFKISYSDLEKKVGR